MIILLLSLHENIFKKGKLKILNFSRISVKCNGRNLNIAIECFDIGKPNLQY